MDLDFDVSGGVEVVEPSKAAEAKGWGSGGWRLARA